LTASLFEEVASYENLSTAWTQVRRSGLRSQSETTKASIKAYEQGVETRIHQVSQALQDGTFSFGEARAVRIPRPGKDPRPLVVAEIRDRIVQRSILDSLQIQDALWEYVHHPRSFGGLPKRKRVDAMRCACQAMADGATYFIKSDIGDFFTRVLRRDVLERIQLLLPDASLAELLDQATNLEIGNAQEMGALIHLFPDDEEGVAQGCCLSPLFGNVYMHEFDELMNSGEVVTIRYIDDFLILGPDRHSTDTAFGAGRKWLEGHNLGAYQPGDGSGKASAGHVSRGFQFLGCSVTRYIVERSRAARSDFLERVKKKLDEAANGMSKGNAQLPGQYGKSLVRTLALVSRMIHAWTEQYSFCNPTDAFYSVDKNVDRLVDRYLGSFFKRLRKSRTTAEERRRMLGVWLATDGSRDPILPLGDK
jgi:hypothetical protein